MTEFQRVESGKLRLRFHPGQTRAWNSARRIVAVIAGHQSGKTVIGPHWLRREMARCGPGDYIVASPTHQLLIKKALPEFLKLFRRQLGLGEYNGQEKAFTLSPDGQRRLHGSPS